ncbi:MAG TPA: hypothetical protein VK832_13670, partial [Burkholderiaceae bacterium]|nr:hypothetical protein [Burkholderiaceae bacterium]
WTWSGAACIFSAFILLSTVASLSHFGVWHWAWPWCITLACVILAALVGWDGLSQFMQASMLVQLPIAVGAPALAAGLAWHWRNGPPQGVAERRRMQFNPLRRAMSYIKRYSTLEEAGNVARNSRITSARKCIGILFRRSTFLSFSETCSMRIGEAVLVFSISDCGLF